MPTKTMMNPEAAALSKSGIYASIARMNAFLVVMLMAAIALAPTLRPIWAASKGLNSVIIAAFAVGVALSIHSAFSLIRASNWMNGYLAKGQTSAPPSTLSPIVFQLESQRRTSRGYMDGASMHMLLGIVRARLKGMGAVPRYIAGILTFLGLLGTFWGLLLTLGAAGDIVKSAAGTEALKAGILKPMGGMGTAFSTSLFGLTCSLALGFLQLQGELASRFFFESLEDNLMKYTRLSAGGAGQGAESGVLPYLQAMLEQTADNLNSLQRLMARSTEANADAAKKMAEMTTAVADLSAQMRDKLKVMERISTAPEKLYSTLNDLVKISKSGFGMDERTKEHIRSIDYRLDEMTSRLSGDLRLLAKAKK
ncbi:MAG: hypothetical protein LBL52_01970 [Rickettsiales bacterium]|jgi:hypothetical protein|nr:hypothetical protein [Rickettsiales bacterium]